MVRSPRLFSQLLEQVPHAVFAKPVDRHGAEYRAKGFTCWTQFVAMVFCQLAQADFLRKLCNGLACCWFL